MDELVKLLNIRKQDISKYKIRYLKQSPDGNEPYDLILKDKRILLDWLGWKFSKTDILGNCEIVIGLVRNYKKSNDSWVYIGSYRVERKPNFDKLIDTVAYNLIPISDDYAYNLEIEYQLPNNQTSIEFLASVLNKKENEMKKVDKNNKGDYTWIPIVEELSEKLLRFKNNRKELVDIFYEILNQEGKLDVSDDRNCNLLTDATGKKIKFKDIDPFTFMNRLGMYSESNNNFRINFITFLKKKLKLKSDIPTGFDGIPSVIYTNTWFFPHIYKQKGDEINKLWNLFEIALLYSNSKVDDNEFINAFDKVDPSIDITCALFRAKPSFYVSLDSNSITCLNNKYNININKNKFKGLDYVNYLKEIKRIIKKDKYVNNADFSYKSWLKYKKTEKNKTKNPNDKIDEGRTSYGKNIIYYGVPGCGKSFKVNLESQNYDYVIRTVFHPDYTYTDFVGQVMPISTKKNGITYEPIAGPFTNALAKAYKNKNKKKVLLIIEEINRGNAAAIFGDIFQLLDRKDNLYSIENEFICSYLRKNTNNYFQKNEFNLPDNLDIIATMNTSDQNVYTLDTAFRRRFEYVRVENEIDLEDKTGYSQKLGSSKIKLNLGDPDNYMYEITWNTFYREINNYIVTNENLLLNNEDKRLGAYSVTLDDFEDVNKFADKVLFYLWDNIGKYNSRQMFNENVNYKLYDQVINDFVNEKVVFCSKLCELLRKKSNRTNIKSKISNKDDNELV